MPIPEPLPGASVRSSGSQAIRRIFRAAVVLAILSIAVKLVGFAREVFLADAFGRGDEIEAFIIAWTIPGFLINVIGGTFGSAIVPTYLDEYAKRGAAAADRLLGSTAVLGFGLLLFVSLILALTYPWLLPRLGSRFSPDKIALTGKLFLILLPVLSVQSLGMLWTSILYARERFGFPSLVQVLPPLVSIGALLLARRCGWDGIHALSWGVLGGTALQSVALATALGRVGHRCTPRWYGYDAALGQVATQYCSLLSGAVLMSGTTLVDQVMSAMLEPGSVAVLNYAGKLVAFAVSLGTMTLGTAALPYFSRLVSARDWVALKQANRFYQLLVFVFVVPVIALFWRFGEPIVALLFERGAFDSADTRLVAEVSAYLLLQIPFAVAGILIVRIISALRANQLLLWGNVISLTLNVGLNLLLMRYLGVAGIALSTSLVFVVAYLYLSLCLRWKLQHVSDPAGASQ